MSNSIIKSELGPKITTHKDLSEELSGEILEPRKDALSQILKEVGPEIAGIGVPVLRMLRDSGDLTGPQQEALDSFL